MAGQTGTWNEADIPDQTGRTVLVTGANSGLGLRTAQVLAEKGATVLLACRSAERGVRALDTVAERARTRPVLVSLDLADLASVRDAAATVREQTGDSLDVLVNNAGVMAPPKGVTKDGFETQFGTNYLGPAALTWLLMPALRRGRNPRVVTVSSAAATGSRLDLDDPNFERRRYNPATAYRQSKLADQVFAAELDRRLRAAHDPVLSVAAHPGYSRSELGSTMAKSQSNALVRTVVDTTIRLGELFLAQNVRMGALPQLYAATAPGIRGGEYVGPRGPFGVRGHPAVGRPLPPARDRELGARLWDLTAKLTGITPDPA